MTSSHTPETAQQLQKGQPSFGVSDGYDDAAFCWHDEPCVDRKGITGGCAVSSGSTRQYLLSHPSTTDNHHDCGMASAMGDVARKASCVASVGGNGLDSIRWHSEKNTKLTNSTHVASTDSTQHVWLSCRILLNCRCCCWCCCARHDS